MPKKPRKRRSLKKLLPEERRRNAKRWLDRGVPKDLLLTYSRRYRVSESDAHFELAALGFGDTLRIEWYEAEGIEWEYKVDGYSGDMKVVPKGTPDWELHLF